MGEGKRHVIWDGYAIGPGHSGIARHARLLCRELRLLGTRPLFLNPSFDFQSDDKYDIDAMIVRPARSTSTRVGHKILRTLAWKDDEEWLASLLMSNHAVIDHSKPSAILHGLSNFNIPLGLKIRTLKRVLTVHDLIPILAKREVSRALGMQMSFLLPKALAAADRIIAVSQWTADTLAEKFPSIAQRVTVIPNGFVNPHDFIAKLAHVSRETSGKDKNKQFLMVSRYEKYKRFDRLVAIVKHSSPLITATVVTDSKGVRYFHENAKNPIEQGRLKVLSGVSDVELDQHYLRADALLHLSQYEGFCLPAAEAIARRTPVIFQKGSGIDEVVGPCGFGMSSGASIADWANLLESEEWRCEPQILLDWINKQIDWSKVAERTREVYNDV